MKQTAVEWLHEQIEQYILTHGNLPFNVLSKFNKQAKAMEKQQIEEAFYCGNQIYGNWDADSTIYYNETYQK